MRTIVSGSRILADSIGTPVDKVAPGYLFGPNGQKVHAYLDQVFDLDSILITGMAEGVDLHAKYWAMLNQIVWAEFPVTKADWNRWGKFAGQNRNWQMAYFAKESIGEVGNLISIVGSPSGTAGSNNMKEIAVLVGMNILTKYIQPV